MEIITSRAFRGRAAITAIGQLITEQTRGSRVTRAINSTAIASGVKWNGEIHSRSSTEFHFNARKTERSRTTEVYRVYESTESQVEKET